MRTRRGGPVILFEVFLLEEPLVGHEKGVSEYRDALDETEKGLTRVAMHWQSRCRCVNMVSLTASTAVMRI